MIILGYVIVGFSCLVVVSTFIDIVLIKGGNFKDFIKELENNG